MTVSIYDNVNPVSTETATFLRICNTCSITISVNVISNNRSETKRAASKPDLVEILKNKNYDDKLGNNIYSQSMFIILY